MNKIHFQKLPEQKIRVSERKMLNVFRKNVQVKRKQRWQNSLVAPHNSHTYQVDVLFMPKKI